MTTPSATWREIRIEHPDGSVSLQSVPSFIDTLAVRGLLPPSYNLTEESPITRVPTYSIPIPSIPGETFSAHGYTITNITGSPNIKMPTGQEILERSIDAFVKLLKDSVQIQTRISLSGTDLTVQTKLVFTGGRRETVISEDEDSVDLEELLDRL